MNSFDLKATALSYLGFYGVPTEQMRAQLDDGIAEARRYARFRAEGMVLSEPLPFLQRPPYAQFLAGCDRYALVAMTLGVELDRRIGALFRTQPERAVLVDACASALLEAESDAWEEGLGTPRTARFCPGYGGSAAGDIREIFALLPPERMGIQLLPSGLMVPQKSMAGIVGLGKHRGRSCGACMLRAHCSYLKEGTKCYRSENN